MWIIVVGIIFSLLVCWRMGRVKFIDVVLYKFSVVEWLWWISLGINIIVISLWVRLLKNVVFLIIGLKDLVNKILEREY